MTIKSLGNPFDGDIRLTHTQGCECSVCRAGSMKPGGLDDREHRILLEQQAEELGGLNPPGMAAAG